MGSVAASSPFHPEEHVLMPIARDFKPDLVVVSAGFDAAVGDPLGGCKVTPACYHELTRQLMEPRRLR